MRQCFCAIWFLVTLDALGDRDGPCAIGQAGVEFNGNTVDGHNLVGGNREVEGGEGLAHRGALVEDAVFETTGDATKLNFYCHGGIPFAVFCCMLR